METYNPSTLLDEIQGLREEVRQVADFIKELKREYSVLEEKIELNSSDVMRLLGISKASLARWRDANAVPYRYVSCNHVLYPFKGLYIAVKSGRATFKGFYCCPIKVRKGIPMGLNRRIEAVELSDFAFQAPLVK